MRNNRAWRGGALEVGREVSSRALRRVRSPGWLLQAGVWIFLLFPAASTAEIREKTIFGRVEHVLIGESRLDLTAKLDTGADTSSLHTTKIRRYRSKDRQIWLEFRVQDPSSGRRIRFKRRLVRYAHIKEHDGPSQKRPVVEMELCLGTDLRRIEVNLVDRGRFDYPMLLGRNALEGYAIVDVELENTRPPSCPIGESP